MVDTMLISVAIVFVVLVGIFGFATYNLWKMNEDFRHSRQPSGVEATVEVLANTGGECIFEHDGKRLMTDTSVFGSGHCKHLPGERMNVYQTNGGWWGIKK